LGGSFVIFIGEIILLLYMDDKIKKLYDNLTYFDQYGSSVFLVIIITIVLIVLVSYCYIIANIQPIKDDWINQRCKPYIIPFAGIINKPDGDTINNYTTANFTYCTQNILQGITGEALKPLTFVTKMFLSVIDSIKNAINEIRSMIDKVRNLFQTVVQEIMGRLMNVMVPLQQIIISVRDFIGKLQGTMTVGLLTSLSTYYTLKALLGAIAQFIVIILIALSAMIALFWIFPFTWGAAIANTSIFIAVAIPLALILTFMSDVLRLKSGLSIPSVKCFDKNTVFEMYNGDKKKAHDIKVGDKLKNSVFITAKIMVETKGSIMYNLNGIIVSDTHKVYYKNKLIMVSNHPDSIIVENYNEPYLYCFNTNTKTIVLNDLEFSDWDDLDKYDDTKQMMNIYTKINSIKNKYSSTATKIKEDEIHKYLDGGFTGDVEIKLKNGQIKPIKNINIGDILEKGERVYGCVEIDGANLSEQYIYNLDKNVKISGGPNICFCSQHIPILTTLDFEHKKNSKKTNEEKLYHLLTDSQSFYIKNLKIYDYNSCIDIFLNK